MPSRCCPNITSNPVNNDDGVTWKYVDINHKKTYSWQNCAYRINYVKTTTGAPTGTPINGEVCLNTADFETYTASGAVWGSAVAITNRQIFIFMTKGNDETGNSGTFTFDNKLRVYDGFILETYDPVEGMISYIKNENRSYFAWDGLDSRWKVFLSIGHGRIETSLTFTAGTEGDFATPQDAIDFISKFEVFAEIFINCLDKGNVGRLDFSRIKGGEPTGGDAGIIVTGDDRVDFGQPMMVGELFVEVDEPSGFEGVGTVAVASTVTTFAVTGTTTNPDFSSMGIEDGVDEVLVTEGTATPSLFEKTIDSTGPSNQLNVSPSSAVDTTDDGAMLVLLPNRKLVEVDEDNCAVIIKNCEVGISLRGFTIESIDCPGYSSEHSNVTLSRCVFNATGGSLHCAEAFDRILETFSCTFITNNADAVAIGTHNCLTMDCSRFVNLFAGGSKSVLEVGFEAAFIIARSGQFGFLSRDHKTPSQYNTTVSVDDPIQVYDGELNRTSVTTLELVRRTHTLGKVQVNGKIVDITTAKTIDVSTATRIEGGSLGAAAFAYFYLSELGEFRPSSVAPDASGYHPSFPTNRFVGAAFLDGSAELEFDWRLCGIKETKDFSEFLAVSTGYSGFGFKDVTITDAVVVLPGTVINYFCSLQCHQDSLSIKQIRSYISALGSHRQIGITPHTLSQLDTLNGTEQYKSSTIAIIDIRSQAVVPGADTITVIGGSVTSGHKFTRVTP